MDDELLKISTTVSGNPPVPGFEKAGAPGPIKENGQHTDYWILNEEERKKGFVRPVRYSYIHEGTRPKFPLRDLTIEEHKDFDKYNYVSYEEYPPELGEAALGRFWTQKELNSGCGGETTMGVELSETYARDPGYYGSTFCCNCGAHFPVGEYGGEFVWSADGLKVGV